MKKCTDAVVDWMVRNNAIEKTDRELYEYAIYSFVLTVTPLLLAAGIGSSMGCAKQAIVLVIPFMLLRKFSGGYHSKHLWQCLLTSGLLLFLCISLTMKVQADWKLAVITAVASISLMIFSPIDSENRVLDKEERRDYKKIAIFFLLLFGVIESVLYYLGWYGDMVCISVGILLSAGLQIPCIVKRICN